MRKRNVFSGYSFLACLWLILSLQGGPEALAQLGSFGKSKKPKLTVQLFSSVKQIQPGKPFEVALQLDIEDEWHAYWKNSGDSGMPPKVNWRLPDGFTVSAFRFPVPMRHVDAGGLVTNILEGQPILTATLTPPTDLVPGIGVTLKADLRVWVCKDICVIRDRSVEIKLPVIAIDATAQPDNDEVFGSAGSAFPEPLAAAKYVRLEPAVNVDKARPKDSIKFAMVVDIDKGLHLQSDKPLSKYLIATDLFMENTEGLSFSKARYPEHEVRTLPGNMQVAEFTGRVIIRSDVEADNTLPEGPLRIAGVFRYQACNDKGQCFPPQNIEWKLVVPAGQEADEVRHINEPYFAQTSGVSGNTSNPPDHPPGWRPWGSEENDTGDPLQKYLGRFGIVGLLVGCFLYGLFLNATPCVFPILSIKVLGFVQQAHESRRRTLALGLAFGTGVVLLFVALGFLAATGKNLLQYPAVVIGLSAVVMALALSMLGVYTLQTPTAATKLEGSIKQEGLLGSFGKGALAPILGFACTGPLLAGVFGWATQQPPQIAVFAFLFTGLGMASPYMLLGANPNWLSFLPKPGLWMVTFERIMGFLLLAMVIWLLHPLVAHMGPEGLEGTLVFFVAIGMGCWILGRINMAMSTGRRWRYRGGAAALVLGTGVFIYGVALADPVAEVNWQPWSPVAVEEAVRSGKTVLVDFTAAYCTVCKQNKLVAFNTREVVGKISELGVVPLQGDFTKGDPEIAAMLAEHGRAGVPLNLIYSPGNPNHPIVLQPVLTKNYLLEKLDEAGYLQGEQIVSHQ